MDRGEGETFLFGKHCFEKENYYIVTTCGGKVCKADSKKVTPKDYVSCNDGPGGISPVAEMDASNDVQILLSNLEGRSKRNAVARRETSVTFAKGAGFHASGFLIAKESEVSKDRFVDYAKSLKKPGVKNILYFQENKISVYRIGEEIKPANLKDVLPECK